MREQYTGHGAKTGGLQQHSVGDMYPYTVIGFGDGTWAAMDTRSASTGERRLSYKEAELDVHSAKIRNLMHS